MCDVHLVEASRVIRWVARATACCYCAEPVVGEGVHIEGRLDDGSVQLHRFVYHEDCVWDMEHDLEEIDAHDGCFSYGKAVEIVDPGQGVHGR